jgi:transposase
MSKARLVITAVTVEKRPVGEVARAYGVARSWIYTLLARYREEGEAAFEPRSRRPLTSPAAISTEPVELIVALRKELAGQGLDAGPDTIAWHLERHHQVRVSAATVARYLARHGLVVPEPRKRPKSSYIRFAAAQPNECWQSDFTCYPLAGGADTEILTWLDDHSRLALRVTAWNRVTGPIVLAEFRAAAARHGPPASTLTDNGMAVAWKPGRDCRFRVRLCLRVAAGRSPEAGWVAVTAGAAGFAGTHPPGIRTAISSRPGSAAHGGHHSPGVVDGQRPAGGTGVVGGRRPGGVLALVQLGEHGVRPFGEVAGRLSARSATGAARGCLVPDDAGLVAGGRRWRPGISWRSALCLHAIDAQDPTVPAGCRRRAGWAASMAIRMSENSSWCRVR